MGREPTLISFALTASTMAAGVDSDDDWETVSEREIHLGVLTNRPTWTTLQNLH